MLVSGHGHGHLGTNIHSLINNQGWGRYSKFEKILDTDTCLPPGTADPVRYSNSANFTDPDTDTVTDTAASIITQIYKKSVFSLIRRPRAILRAVLSSLFLGIFREQLLPPNWPPEDLRPLRQLHKLAK